MTTPAGDFSALQSRVAGRYSIERELGRGGMGVVYLATDVALDRRIAIKLLPAEFAAQSVLRERFIREARLAARLSHPHIVPIHSVEEHTDAVFFVMGYIEGETLGDRIQRVGALPPAEVTVILQQVAWALAYAHGRGVIHRDIKPDNILIERGAGRAWVMDFGIARAAETSADDQRASTMLTQAGHVVGTAAFMSPEQATGETVDARSDLYSLGVVGFVALAGRLPFSAPNAQALIAKHLTEPAPPVASLRPGLAPQLANTVDRLLAKDPAARFDSGEAVADALGPAAAAGQAIAPALRNYLRYAEQQLPVFMIIAAIVVTVSLLRPEAFSILMAVGGGSLVANWFGLIAITRRLIKLGYRLPDVRQAVQIDSRLRDEEERAFTVGVDPSQRGKVMRGALVWMAAGIILFAAACVAALALKRAHPPSWRPMALGAIGVGMLALVVGTTRFVMVFTLAAATGRRFASATSLNTRLWASPIASALFALSSMGVTATPPRDAAGALDLLLDEAGARVGRVGRGVVNAARARIDALHDEMDGLRAREQELDRSLAETGDQHTSARLRAARSTVATDRERAAAQIDAIRMKLILVRSGVAGADELRDVIQTDSGGIA